MSGDSPILLLLPDKKSTEAVNFLSINAFPTINWNDAGFTCVYAPGTGSNINDPFGHYLATHLAAAGESFRN